MVKNKTLFKSLLTIPVNHHKRTTLKWLGGSLLLASMGANAIEKTSVHQHFVINVLLIT